MSEVSEILRIMQLPDKQRLAKDQKRLAAFLKSFGFFANKNFKDSDVLEIVYGLEYL
jgi:hypothetical protein